MTNKSTKKALLLSALSMLLCVAMLVGTTFAWFTDSVTSGKNKIVAGNLDIELEYTKDPSDADSWATVKDATDLLNKDALWEPGHAEVVYLRISNLGTLALKYQFAMNIYSEVEGTNVAGEKFMLSDHLKYGVVDFTAKFADRDAAVKAVESSAVALDNYTVNGTMLAGDPAKTVALVVYMPTSVGNEANYRGTQIPTIELGVELKATQLAYEKDFFGSDYDENAPWLGSANLDWYTADPTATEFTISTAEELAGFAQIVNGTAVVGSTYSLRSTPATLHDDFQNKTVKLDKDIDLNDLAWTPIGRIGTTSTDFNYAFRGTFDGQNHTVKNLTASGYGWVGLFGIAYQADINNVKLDGVKLDGNRMTGALVGQLYGSIDNCHVSGAYIKVIPNAVGDSFDNGDKVGGIVGWLGDNGNNRTLTNCSATDIDVIGYRDVGGIAGYVASSTVIKNNSATKVRITIDQLTNYYGDKDTNAGLIYGRTGGTVVDDGSNKADAESVINQSYLKDGLQFTKNSSTGETVLYLVPSNYAKDTVKVPEGVTTIGNYAFAYNSNVEAVELPSTVTDLGRGFDTSTVKKVVLNEGLQTISSRAFRRTYELEEVVISSTVTTVADNAFQSSGIKKIVFPENVTYIGDSCFTAATVETVVIEGKNVEIAHFAFRDCPNLTTVTIFSDSVTFGEGMIFTNSQNNNQNPNKITVYVKNEAVKNALVANGTFNGVIKVMDEIDNSGDIAGSMTDGADTVYVPAGNYTFPSSSVTEGDTIVCAPGTVFEGTTSLNVNGATVVGGTFTNDSGYAVSGTVNGTFKDCVFEASEALRWCYTNEGETVVFENCVFKTDFRGIHFDAMNGDVIFRNCEINGFNAFSGNGTMTFEGCTFGYDESSYNGLNIYTNTTIKDCTFNYKSGKTDFIDMEGTGKTLTITNCVATQDGETIDIKSKIGGSKLAQNTVKVDGDYFVTSSEALKAAIEAKASKIVLANGDYSVRFTNNTSFNADNMTFVGLGDKVNVAVTSSEVWYGRIQGDNMTFENIHFTGDVGSTGKSTYNNCVFDGWAICAAKNVETAFNKCTIKGCLNTSSDFDSGNVYAKDSKIAKAEYSFSSDASAMNFENCEIGELISWNANTVLTNCTVTTLDDTHMTTNTITIN